MHTTTPKKKETWSKTIQVKRTNLFPIHVQIALLAQSKRHDKSRNRSKAKRAWKADS